MSEPKTRLCLEAPRGLADVEASRRDGAVVSVTLTNTPPFGHCLAVSLEVPGLGTLTLDAGFGGDSFATADADALCKAFNMDAARDLVGPGTRITDVENPAIGSIDPEPTGCAHCSVCLVAGPPDRKADGLDPTPAVAIPPDKFDRSPTDTTLPARMAVLAARGTMGTDEVLVPRSIVGSEFTGQIRKRISLQDIDAILPTVTAPEGYRVGDARPGA